MAPKWFWRLSPTDFFLGMGVMELKGEKLTRFRAFIDRRGDDLQDALESAGQSVGARVNDWGPEALKKVPKPYDADHPHAALLKRKALAMSAPMGEDWKTAGVLKASVAVIEGMLPIWRQFDTYL